MGLWKQRKIIRVSRSAFNAFCDCTRGGNLDEGMMMARIRHATEGLRRPSHPNYYDEREALERKYISELEKILAVMRNGYSVEVVAYD